MSYAKQKGTAYETAIVNYLKDFGFKDARRVVLGGANGDNGDIHVGPVYDPFLVIECKNYAKELPYKQIEDFIGEAIVEWDNAHGDSETCYSDWYYRALLFVKRPNLGVADSWICFKNSSGITMRCRLGDIINETFFNKDDKDGVQLRCDKLTQLLRSY